MSAYGQARTLSAPGDRKVTTAAEAGASALGCKWSLAILGALVDGPERSLALGRRLRAVPRKVLYERLRKLEDSGLVRRADNGRYPLVVYYGLSAKGRRLRPLLVSWQQLGLNWEVLEMTLKCKWTCPILYALSEDALTPSSLRARLSGLGKRQAFQRLAWLQERGIVERRVVATRPPTSVYALTPAGYRLAAMARRWERLVRGNGARAL